MVRVERVERTEEREGRDGRIRSKRVVIWAVVEDGGNLLNEYSTKREAVERAAQK